MKVVLIKKRSRYDDIETVYGIAESMKAAKSEIKQIQKKQPDLYGEQYVQFSFEEFELIKEDQKNNKNDKVGGTTTRRNSMIMELQRKYSFEEALSFVTIAIKEGKFENKKFKLEYKKVFNTEMYTIKWK